MEETPDTAGLERRLLALGKSISDRLSAFLAGMELAQAGEYLVALEILCDNLHEYDIPISAPEFAEIESLALVFKMKQGRVDMLRPQVTQ